MAETTVKQLAEAVGTPVDRLLQQMKDAGLPQAAETDVVAEAQKESLLAYLKRSHGEETDGPKKITLKRRTLSTIKAGGSAGRGRTVNVEVRKKRTYVRRDDADVAAEVTPEVVAEVVAEVAPVIVEEEVIVAPVVEVVQPVEVQEEPEVDVPPKPMDPEAIRRAAFIASEKEAEARKNVLKEREEKAAAEAAAAAEKAKQAEVLKAKSSKPDATKDSDDKAGSRKDKRDRKEIDIDEIQQKKAKHGNRKKRVEELQVEEVDDILIAPGAELEDDLTPTTLGLTGVARSKRAAAPKAGPRHQFNAPTQDQVREVEVGESITISQLSQRMSIKARDVIKYLMGLGVMADMNAAIDQETAILVVEEFGHKVKLLDANEVETSLLEALVYDSEAEARSPVVTVMGHVDHGKTSLLDYIRSAEVAGGEAGGITQHIGAYRVKTKLGEICFIDTPGHAAFSAMRARGASATDIIILVVAADDGVMPQTEEAINHAKSAGVPLVVAINKMDKEGADIDRVKNELAAKNVIPEDWGGDTQFLPVSALTGDGVDALLEAVLLQAELLELTAVKEGPAQGVVIESRLDKGKGSVATLLVQNGTLSRGDIVVAGENFGRVRAITDENGQTLTSAGPATPVSIQGLNGTPGAGDPFTVTKDEKAAREVAEFRREKQKSERLATPVVSLDNLLENFGAQAVQSLNIVVKADVRGSLEAIVSALHDLGNEEVKVNVISSGVGGISENDVNYALTAQAVIFGFNVRAESSAKRLVDAESLDLRYYKVIYDLVDDVRDALSGMLAPEIREDIVGIAEVKDVFDSKKFGSIAGCMVIEGTVHRRKKIRVLRDNVVIYEGELESLRHFKDEVESIRSGTECGIGVKNYNDVRVKDQIEVFDTREVARQL
ncbi:MAG: translation initiation factor IF-2 [Gammaproteobacteria bacterium]|jgi:translation initiation factor IF-2|nr:translation initiation factor IF-2 [Gammaproteobacteria bacterium]MDC0464279.1 translation initiation factor IF-2 [Pseudomonadales bacterium]